MKRLRSNLFANLAVVVLALSMVGNAQEYPFRDPSLPIERRITDLLSRLTVDEKISLMGGEPRISRLGLKFSGQVEVLVGLSEGEKVAMPTDGGGMQR